MATAKAKRRAAIVVGGTGLYFNALTRGLAAVPPIPADIRATVRSRLKTEGVAALHAELHQRDPAMAARLMPGDRSRIIARLEVIVATGRSLLAWHEEGMPAGLDASRAAKIFLMPDRDELFRRIDARFEAMIAAGAIEEVRALAARHLDPDLPAMKAHGVPWLIRHLKGELTLAEAIEGSQRDTRQYTKRQATWFRNRLPGFAWVEPERACGSRRGAADARFCSEGCTPLIQIPQRREGHARHRRRVSRPAHQPTGLRLLRHRGRRMPPSSITLHML